MLYLEDYLEMIENLPIEMRDRFTEIREMDLQVQNAMDSLDDRVKNFFKKCGSAPIPKTDWKDEQFKKVKEDYKNALEDADEKVQLANQIYDLLERHLRKLDQELSKFKMELEADNGGITEILEKRSLELDQQPRHANNHRAEKRKYMSAFSNHIGDKKTSTEKVLSSLAHEAAKETLATHRSNSATSSPSANMFDSSNATSRAPALSYNLGHVGAGSNAAIAQAASRAIGATLEMGHGRRTASMKASYEVVTKNPDLTKDLLLRNGSSTSAVTAEPPPKSSRKKGSSQQQPAVLPAIPEQVIVEEVPVDGAVGKDGSPVDWMVDPNEPRYCLCNEVSYGEMVGCDNDDCPIEWFHYGCVGLTQAPKGKWYCPQCKDAMKRRGRK